MCRKLSSIDFSLFIGQTVVEVNTDKNIAFGMTFESSYLTIECPWRIRASNEVLLGYSDIIHSKGKFTHKHAEKILLGKRIINMVHFEEVADLIVEFEDNIYVELYHDSTYFEGWQLGADNGFLLVSLPGGASEEF